MFDLRLLPFLCKNGKDLHFAQIIGRSNIQKWIRDHAAVVPVQMAWRRRREQESLALLYYA